MAQGGKWVCPSFDKFYFATFPKYVLVVVFVVVHRTRFDHDNDFQSNKVELSKNSIKQEESGENGEATSLWPLLPPVQTSF